MFVKMLARGRSNAAEAHATREPILCEMFAWWEVKMLARGMKNHTLCDELDQTWRELKPHILCDELDQTLRGLKPPYKPNNAVFYGPQVRIYVITEER